MAFLALASPLLLRRVGGKGEGDPLYQGFYAPVGDWPFLRTLFFSWVSGLSQQRCPRSYRGQVSL